MMDASDADTDDEMEIETLTSTEGPEPDLEPAPALVRRRTDIATTEFDRVILFLDVYWRLLI